MKTRIFRIGTRGSALALWQAHHVEGLLRARPNAPQIELVRIRTEGDVRTDVPLWQVGGRAFFTKEIDKALLGGEVDIAVHSLKDLSTTLESGIALAAVLEREDPRDALISRDGQSLDQLPRGARIGTSSLRRRALLARIRPDAVLLELRGNVPTRIERLKAGDYDAIVLAAAGLRRLGLEKHIAQALPVEEFPPAVSQGAIGVCARETDLEVLSLLKPLDNEDSRVATTAERALLRTIEGGCQVPLGALGTVRSRTPPPPATEPNKQLTLHAAVSSHDGARMLRAAGSAAATPSEAERLGQQLAHQLLAQGAAALITTERAVLRSQQDLK